MVVITCVEPMDFRCILYFSILYSTTACNPWRPQNELFCTFVFPSLYSCTPFAGSGLRSQPSLSGQMRALGGWFPSDRRQRDSYPLSFSTSLLFPVTRVLGCYLKVFVQCQKINLGCDFLRNPFFSVILVAINFLPWSSTNTVLLDLSRNECFNHSVYFSRWL